MDLRDGPKRNWHPEIIMMADKKPDFREILIKINVLTSWFWEILLTTYRLYTCRPITHLRPFNDTFQTEFMVAALRCTDILISEREETNRTVRCSIAVWCLTLTIAKTWQDSTVVATALISIDADSVIWYNNIVESILHQEAWQ